VLFTDTFSTTSLKYAAQRFEILAEINPAPKTHAGDWGDIEDMIHCLRGPQLCSSVRCHRQKALSEGHTRFVRLEVQDNWQCLR
jgi:hypothetical protein